MKENINIAEILKNKQKGIRLYSPIFGECAFCHVSKDTNDICVKKRNGVIEYFNSEGLYFALGEVMLFPSREMHDWFKLALKRGDALSCGVDNLCIFEKWANKEYTEFYAKFVTPNYSGNTFKTEKWSKETNEAVIKQYISNIDELKGSKLNLTTLEIEKTQPEFKDGDIITFKDRIIIIYNTSIEKSTERTEIYYHACLKEGELTVNEYLMSCGFGEGWYSSTEEEKHNLFEALEKKGKRWDSEKKQIVDLKPKWTPKTFDKVITRVHNKAIWTANIFSHIDQHGKYVTIGCISGYTYCLPYNDETSHLIGTTDEWKGGEHD